MQKSSDHTDFAIPVENIAAVDLWGFMYFSRLCCRQVKYGSSKVLTPINSVAHLLLQEIITSLMRFVDYSVLCKRKARISRQLLRMGIQSAASAATHMVVQTWAQNSTLTFDLQFKMFENALIQLSITVLRYGFSIWFNYTIIKIMLLCREVIILWLSKSCLKASFWRPKTKKTLNGFL